MERSEADCLAFARQVVLSPIRSWWHLSHFIVAEVDGTCAAALCGLPVDGTVVVARAAIDQAMVALGFDVAEQAGFGQRSAYVRHCWMQGHNDDWIVEHVATRPGYRGRGLIAALLSHALAAGAHNGYKRAQITFYIGNEAAERSYARAGFRFAEEKRHPEFEAQTGAPGFRRFARDLSDC